MRDGMLVGRPGDRGLRGLRRRAGRRRDRAHRLRAAGRPPRASEPPPPAEPLPPEGGAWLPPLPGRLPPPLMHSVEHRVDRVRSMLPWARSRASMRWSSRYRWRRIAAAGSRVSAARSRTSAMRSRTSATRGSVAQPLLAALELDQQPLAGSTRWSAASCARLRCYRAQRPPRRVCRLGSRVHRAEPGGRPTGLPEPRQGPVPRPRSLPRAGHDRCVQPLVSPASDASAGSVCAWPPFKGRT